MALRTFCLVSGGPTRRAWSTRLTGRLSMIITFSQVNPYVELIMNRRHPQRSTRFCLVRPYIDLIKGSGSDLVDHADLVTPA
jgi:hypothetical protein